jgi:hypothetical protein
MQLGLDLIKMQTQVEEVEMRTQKGQICSEMIS